MEGMPGRGACVKPGVLAAVTLAVLAYATAGRAGLALYAAVFIVTMLLLGRSR
jgi:hypothetical protein